MKRLSVAACYGVLALVVGCGAAFAQPAIIPHLGRAPHDANATFRTLKSYFADTALSQFRLVSADPATRTIVAKRSAIDSATWTKWAYCKMSATHLIDSLNDASATVNVKIDRAGRHASEVRVGADFEGTYGLGSNVTTQQCISNGVLEQSILVTAGVPAAAN